jgi:agmatinase
MSRIAPGDQAFDADSVYGTEDEYPFSGTRSFLRRRLSRELAGVDYAVLGVPFDLSTCGRPGARFGPEGLRRASAQLAWGAVWPWAFDPFDRLAVVDYGDVFYRRGQVDALVDALLTTARRILAAGTRLIALGGDHMVTYPLLQAHAEVHGPLGLIHFDAHRDTMAAPELDHGTFAWHAMQDGLVDPHRSVQIGIRTHYTLDDPVTVLHRPWVREHGVSALVAEIERVVGDGPCYLTFDIDAVDPAFAPGTGTPVVDGLLPGEVIETIRALTVPRIVGMDVVEVSPPYDHAEVTALLGASLILEHLCAVAASRPDRTTPP